MIDPSACLGSSALPICVNCPGPSDCARAAISAGDRDSIRRHAMRRAERLAGEDIRRDLVRIVLAISAIMAVLLVVAMWIELGDLP